MYRYVTKDIVSVGGRVTLMFANKVLVAIVPREFIVKQNGFASATAHISEAAASPDIMTYMQAYWRVRAKKTQPQPPVQRWNEKTAPTFLPAPQEAKNNDGKNCCRIGHCFRSW
jgi:hypothetical protein